MRCGPLGFHWKAQGMYTPVLMTMTFRGNHPGYKFFSSHIQMQWCKCGVTTVGQDFKQGWFSLRARVVCREQFQGRGWGRKDGGVGRPQSRKRKGVRSLGAGGLLLPWRHESGWAEKKEAAVKNGMLKIKVTEGLWSLVMTRSMIGTQRWVPGRLNVRFLRSFKNEKPNLC